MGFLDGLFGASENETTTKVEYPKWVEQASKGNYDLAKTIASRPYTPYPYQRIAGFTDDQTGAMGMLRDYAPTAQKNGQGFDVPRMIDPIGKGGTVEAYMNPYIDNVLDRTQNRIRQATDMAKQWQSNMGQHQAGAFGDARHGIADAQIEKSGIQQMGDAAAEGYAQAYESAQGYRSQDINRMFDAERMRQAQQQQFMSYIDALFRSGSNQQNLGQKNMDLAYQDFLKQQGYPIEQYNMLTAALNKSPYGQQTTNTQPGPSAAGQGLGLIGGLASLFI